MKNNNLIVSFLIAPLLLPQVAISGFLDDLKSSINISFPNSKQCKSRADIYRKSQIATLSAKSSIYRGPGYKCGVTARTANGGNVKIIGEHADWYYIAINDTRGRQIKGWSPKSRVALPSAPRNSNGVEQIQNQPPKQKNIQAKIPNNRPVQTYPKEMVAEVQQLLNEQGYDAGPADGLYGKGTRAAVMSFQRGSGLKETGKLDLDTLSTLKQPKKSKTIVSKAPSSANNSTEKESNKQSNATYDDVIFKIDFCSRNNLTVKIYIDDNVEAWKDDVAKDLLKRGAKYGMNDCKELQYQYLKNNPVVATLYRKAELTKRSPNNHLAFAHFKPKNNYQITKYKNHETKRRESMLAAKRKKEEQILVAKRKKQEKATRERLVKKGNVDIVNRLCQREHNINRVYVPDDIDILDHDHVKSILKLGVNHGKQVCKSTANVVANLFPKSLQDKNAVRPWAYALMTHDGNNIIKYGNAEAKRREDLRLAEDKRLEKVRAKKMRIDHLISFIKNNNAEAYIQVDKLIANPYVYEDKIVVMKARFASMLSKKEALFASKKFFGKLVDVFLVTDVPTTRFKKEKNLLLIGRVIGNKKYELPTGENALITQIRFIDAYEQNYNYDDLELALKQHKLLTR
ncbi:MAG: peptidoglycan-binding domain-containing protein [Candidatus Thiodiazotropha sp. DIVDIV]